MGRRAEWLLIGQLVGNLGPPPWAPTYETELCDKLLGDVAHFLVQASKLPQPFLDTYMAALTIPIPQVMPDALSGVTDVLWEEIETRQDELAAKALRSDAEPTDNDLADSAQEIPSEARQADMQQQGLDPIVIDSKE